MTMALLGLAAVLAAGAGQPAGPEEALRLLALMKTANASVADLECTFRFEVTKGGKRFPPHCAVLRLRTVPETIHMTYVEPNKGRQVLYIKGQNNGKMKVRPGGFWRFLVLSIDPDGEQAMEGAIDPLTAQGLANVVRQAEETIAEAVRAGSCEVSVDWDFRDDKGVYARLRVAGPPVGEMVMLVDKATYMPFRIVKSKGNDGATYTYEDIRLNPGLKDSDFRLSSKH
jgi:Protein of unknown function (DUF1571)